MDEVHGGLQRAFAAARRGDGDALAWSFASALRVASGASAARVRVGPHEQATGSASRPAPWSVLVDLPTVHAAVLHEPGHAATTADDRLVALVVALTQDAWALFEEGERTQRIRREARACGHELRNAINNVHLQFAILDRLATGPDSVPSAAARERASRGFECVKGLARALDGLDKALANDATLA